MLLEKWYLDAVFPDGTVWIGYRARLRLWPGPAIAWAAGCEFCPDGPERKVSRWRNLPAPCLENGRWQWHGPDGFHAQWEPSGPGIESALASDEQFRVNWNCVAPMATVTRSLANGGNNTSPGIGYVENLRIETTRPGLPFRNLWWGRAHAGESSLVWIRWEHGRDFCLLLENGAPVKGGFSMLADGGVCVHTARGCWETGSSRPLLDRDVRRSFPRWLVWLTNGMAPAREHKMAGPVRLRTEAGDVQGSGVWEEVMWP